MSKTQQQQAAAPTPATQDAAPETDTPAQLYKLMTESDTPEKAAAILRANPQIAQFYVDSLHKGYGNEFTMKAIELASDADHSLNVRGRSQLKQSETKVVDATAPTPSEKLPYTEDGGWNAIAINKKLGQHDKLQGTDNDGDRCSYATALAAKIFDGPAAVAAYLEAVLTRHDTEEGRAAKEPAEDVIRTLIPAIRGKTATYADLSWAQEALYEVTLAKGQTGTTGVKQTDAWGRPIAAYTLADDMPSEEINETAWTPEDLISRAKALKPGERLMCGWITPKFQHQIMISNEKGKLLLYDSERQKGGGAHLRDLTVEALEPYYKDDSIDVYLKTKAETPTKPKT